MRIDIITVLPELLQGFTQESILGRAQKKGLVEIHIHNLRDYTLDKWRRVDDYPFGGFAGMVMQCEPIDRCISKLKSERHYDEIIFTTPDGEQFSQPMANSLSLCENIIILCGHYKGIDYRIREHLITKEVSIGDYVLTGGELAAAVMTDAIVRIIPRRYRRRAECPLGQLSGQSAGSPPSIRALPSTRTGAGSPMFSFRATRLRLRSGNCSRALREPRDYARTY